MVLGSTRLGWWRCDGGKRDRPESVGGAMALEEGNIVFGDGDVLCGEGCGAAMVAELADREERVFGQSRKNVGLDGCRGHLWQVEVGRVRGENAGSVGELHGDWERGDYFVGAWSIGLEIVSCGAGIEDASGGGSGIGGVREESAGRASNGSII
jgi:hypothetical protein